MSYQANLIGLSHVACNLIINFCCVYWINVINAEEKKTQIFDNQNSFQNVYFFLYKYYKLKRLLQVFLLQVFLVFHIFFVASKSLGKSTTITVFIFYI